MLEVYLLALLGHCLPNSGNMRIKVLPSCKMFPTVTTAITLSMNLTHMLPQLAFLVKINHFDFHLFLTLFINNRSLRNAQLTKEFAFVCPLYMFSLLVSVGEHLEAPI